MVATNKRVLVVDDEAIVRDSCKLALMDAGYDVRTVGNGVDAIKACRAERFDVMLTDIKMPDMDGLEVARVVLREFPDVRVVIITGYPSRESAEEATRLGALDYIEKPLNPDRLAAATAAALAHPQAAPAPDLAVPAGPKIEEPATAEPEDVGKTPDRRIALNTNVQAVSVTASFLGGVIAAYIVAPAHALAYLAVGTAIAGGTVLGVFADAFSAKRAGANPDALGEIDPEEAGGTSARRVTANAGRQVILIAMGFLGGVLAAYVVSPARALDYLAVGTAVACGIVFGLFSRGFHARSQPTMP